MVMRSIIPVVMAGVLGIYGLITSVIINGHITPIQTYSSYQGYAHLAAGMIVGLVVASYASDKGAGLCGSWAE